jgi:hypothetical protein
MAAEPEGSILQTPLFTFDMNPIQFHPPAIFITYFPKIHPNIILPSSSKDFPRDIPIKLNSVCIHYLH